MDGLHCVAWPRLKQAEDEAFGRGGLATQKVGEPLMLARLSGRYPRLNPEM